MKVFETNPQQINNFYQPMHESFQPQQHLQQTTHFIDNTSQMHQQNSHLSSPPTQTLSPNNINSFHNGFVGYQPAYFNQTPSIQDKKQFKVVKSLNKSSSKSVTSIVRPNTSENQFDNVLKRYNNSTISAIDSHQNHFLQNISSQWDINDSKLPKITNFDEFQTWPQGSVCYAYNKSLSEAARRHSSGWAMRNTNNHNSQILKKSCLGVLICTIQGCDLAMRPAICDKARMRQQGRKCPKPNCPGFIKIQRCRGHEGYPVTHFWREINDTVYFQAKGKHDHGRPDIKPVRDTAARRKRQLEKVGEVKAKISKSTEEIQSTWSNSSPLTQENVHSSSYQSEYFHGQQQDSFNLFSSPLKNQNFINNYYNELNSNNSAQSTWSYDYSPWLNQNDFNNNRIYESPVQGLSRTPPTTNSLTDVNTFNFNSVNSINSPLGNNSYNSGSNNFHHGSSSSSPTSSLHLLSSSSFGQISSVGDSSINNLLNTSLNNINNYQFNNSLDFINDTKVDAYSTSETSTTSTTHRQSDPVKYPIMMSNTLDVI